VRHERATGLHEVWAMSAHLALLAGLCSPAGPVAGAALLSGLLLAGLVGSVVHCGPMCGPFVLGQVADRMARLPAARMCEMSRLGGAMLLPYHIGRLTTYAALGALAGTLGAGGLPARAAGVVLLLAALLFLAHALRLLSPGLRRSLPALDAAPPAWTWLVGRMAAWVGRARWDRTHWASGLLLGLVLGFLPCGMLYGALAAAASTGSPAGGGLAMLVFGLGTVPGLVAVGLAGHAAGRLWGAGVARVAPVVMLLNAAVLAAMAWQRLAGTA